MQFLFYQKPPMAAKRRSLRLPQKFLPPLKTFGFCCAKPKKKRRSCAAILNFSQFWCPCTTRLEPILRKIVEKCKPRRLAQQSCAAPRPENPLHYFFLELPRRDFFRKGKGFFWSRRVCLWQTGGVARGDKVTVSQATH